MKISRLLNRAVTASLAKAHLAIFPYRPGFHYVPDFYGRSARKQPDIRQLPSFGALAARTIAKRRSYLYYDRLFTLYQALANAARLPAREAGTYMAEVGVYRGGTSFFLAEAARELGLKSPQLYCFDTFEGHAAEDINEEIETNHSAGHFSKTSFEAVKALRASFDFVHVRKGRVQDRAGEVASHTFSFIHLDVDIYEPTKFCLEFFDARLVRGAIVVVDDYGFTSCPGAKQAVDEFVSSTKRYVALHQLTGQCVLVKIE